MRLIPLVLALALLAPPAFAAETDWQAVAPGVRLRLISSGQISDDGQTLLGLEIDMPATSKTYWRVPGETGLPTELDFSAAPGVLGHQILWPYPTYDNQNGYADYVYFGPTVLPIEVTLAPDALVAEMTAVLGICSDICVPAQAHFSLQLADAQPDPANELRLRQAVALSPIDWQQKSQPIGDVVYDAQTNMLQVPISDPALDPQSLIAATRSGLPLFGAPQKSPEPDLVLIPVLGQVDQTELARQPVELTFMTDLGAFEIDRPVGVTLTD
ncbi:MAG: protein-disulfide reductase DsbD domain-containing protein [Devosia sp.]